MPCYGHTHCELCGVPICPDCTDSFDEDLQKSPFNWLNQGVAVKKKKFLMYR